MERKQKQSRAKRGRPALPPEAGKRFPLNMRTTKEVRDKLKAASNVSGRSLAQEVEYRLERSFLDEQALYREFGGETLYKLMRWFATTIDLAQQITEKSWKNDRETFRLATNAMWTMLRKGMPESGGLPDKIADRMGKSLGEELAWLASDGRVGKPPHTAATKGKRKG